MHAHSTYHPIDSLEAGTDHKVPEDTFGPDSTLSAVHKPDPHMAAAPLGDHTEAGHRTVAGGASLSCLGAHGVDAAGTDCVEVGLHSHGLAEAVDAVAPHTVLCRPAADADVTSHRHHWAEADTMHMGCPELLRDHEGAPGRGGTCEQQEVAGHGLQSCLWQTDPSQPAGARPPHWLSQPVLSASIARVIFE